MRRFSLNNDFIEKIINSLHKINRNLHRKTPGEALPSSKNAPSLFPSKITKKMIIAMLITFLVLLYVDNSLHWFGNMLVNRNFNVLSSKAPLNQAFILALNPLKARLKLHEVIMLLVVSVIATIFLCQRAGGSDDNETTSMVAYGQKGDSRFTTLKEIQEQYKCIPEKIDKFSGYGGFPVSHYRHEYYIDDEPVHNLIYGTSRIGKSDEIIVPMIENISRAENQSSMIVNDPKKELYTGFAELLKKRGYNVYLLDLDKPMNSMSYNPLSLAVEKWQEGKEDEAIQLINSVSYALFHKDNAGENAWVYQGAQNVSNADITQIIKFCLEPNNFKDNKAHPEKITLYNLSEMVTQLAGVKFTTESNETMEEINVLDDYFNHLPQSSFAKQQYTVIKTSPGRSTGNIYSTMMQNLDNFQLPENAALTSMNSIELRSVGFPKYIKFKLPANMADQKIVIRFRHAPEKGSKTTKIIEQFSLFVGKGGYVDYNFDVSLSSGDLIELCFRQNDQVKHSLIQIDFSKLIDENIHQVKTKVLFDDLNISKIKLCYSDKPTAIFLSVPDYDQSNNALITILIQQLYGELARQCANVAGNKTVRRVQCIWDEFGNMPKIPNMSGMMSVSAGRNILFTLALQSDKQLYSKYGREEGSTIKDNGANQKLIKCIDTQTNESFSKMAGQQTIESSSLGNSSSKQGKSTSYSIHAEAVPLITASRLSQMLAGEDFNIRAVHRFNKWGERIRPYPIFNTEKTIMPGAHTFLKEVDTRADPNLIRISCLHRNLRLKDLEINYSDFIKNIASDSALEAYQKSIGAFDSSEQITKESENNNVDDIDEIEKDVIDNELSLNQEDKRNNSDFARLVSDYRGKGIDLALADKILDAFDREDQMKIRIYINSIENNEIRQEIETMFNTEEF